MATAKKPAPKTAQTKKTVKKAPARKAAVAKRPIVKKTAVKKTTAKPKSKAAAAKTVKPRTLVGKVHHHIKRAFQAGSIKTIAIVGVLFLATIIGVGAYLKLGASASTAVITGKYLNRDGYFFANPGAQNSGARPTASSSKITFRTSAGKIVPYNMLEQIQWSYSGQKLYAVLREDNTGNAGGYKNKGIYQANADGTNAKKILDVTSNKFTIAHFSPSNDDTSVSVSGVMNDTTGQVSRLMVVNTKDATLKQVDLPKYSGYDMVRSQDGKYIAIGVTVGGAGYAHIALFDGVKQVVVSDAIDGYSASDDKLVGWNADGIVLLNKSYQDASIKVQLVPVTVTKFAAKPTLITTLTGTRSSPYIANAEMSRDGQWVVVQPDSFTAIRTNANVQVVNITNKTKKVIANWSKTSKTGLTIAMFSPDSTKLLIRDDTWTKDKLGNELSSPITRTYDLKSWANTQTTNTLQTSESGTAWQGITSAH